MENKARINTTEDERVSISGDAFIELDILVPKTFKDAEAKIKEKLSLKPEWNNGDYDFFDWKLNDENSIGNTAVVLFNNDVMLSWNKIMKRGRF